MINDRNETLSMAVTMIAFVFGMGLGLVPEQAEGARACPNIPNTPNAKCVKTRDIKPNSIKENRIRDRAVTPAKWAGGPAARAYNSTNVSVPNGAFTAIPLDSERFDTGDMHDPFADSSRMTITTPGLYLVGANVTWANNTTGARELNINVNGTTIVARVVQPADPTVNSSDQAVTTLVNLAAGDYVQTIVRHNGGVALDVLASPQFTPEFWATWIGPTPSP